MIFTTLAFIISQPRDLSDEQIRDRAEKFRDVCVYDYHDKSISPNLVKGRIKPEDDFFNGAVLASFDSVSVSIDRKTGYICNFDSSLGGVFAPASTSEPAPLDLFENRIQQVCDAAGLGVPIQLTSWYAEEGYWRVYACPRIGRGIIYDNPLQMMFYINPQNGVVTRASLRWFPVVPDSLEARRTADEARAIAVSHIVKKGWIGDLSELMPMQLVVESPKRIDGPSEGRTAATAAFRTDIVGKLSYHVIYESAANSIDSREKPYVRPGLIHYYIDPNDGKILDLVTFGSGGGAPKVNVSNTSQWKLSPGRVLAMLGGKSKSITIAKLTPSKETLGQFRDIYLAAGKRTVRAGFDAERGLLRVVESKGPVVYQLDAAAAKSLHSILK